MTETPLYSIHLFPGKADEHRPFADDWRAVVQPSGLKETLLSYVDTLHRLRVIPQQALGLRRALLLFGPPGCGKTSLARGIAWAWQSTDADRRAGLIHVNTHALFGGLRGDGQKLVLKLFREIEEHATSGLPIFVLVDEVETLGSDRAGINLETNPLDALYQVTAFLESLDRCVRESPNVIFVFTTNIPRAIDRAVRERVDFSLEVPLPGRRERDIIMRATLQNMAVAFDVAKAASMAESQHEDWSAVVDRSAGLSGRGLRHVFVRAATIADKSPELAIAHVAEALSAVAAVEEGLIDSRGTYIEQYQERRHDK